MSLKTVTRHCLMVGALTVAAAALPPLAVAPAQAGNEPYIGWDFGNGLGVGIGTPPSAHDPCPTYGWAYSPYRCRYRPAHYRPHARPRSHEQHSQSNEGPTNLGPSDQQ